MTASTGTRRDAQNRCGGLRLNLPDEAAVRSASYGILARGRSLAADADIDGVLNLNPVIALAPGEGCRLIDARVKVRTLA